MSLKAIVWHDVGDIRLDNVSELAIKERTDAIARLPPLRACSCAAIGDNAKLDSTFRWVCR